MHKCIITGGCGFIGSNLVEHLLDLGNEVFVIDNLSTGSIENIDVKKVGFYNFDLSEKISNSLISSIIKTLGSVDFIFHLAALPRIQPSFDDPIAHEIANVHATINALELAKFFKVKKFVYSASSSCYGNAEELPTTENCKINPMNPYAIQKYTSELYCSVYDTIHNVSTVRLRYFNAYGPRSYSVNNSQSAYSSVIGIFAYKKIRMQNCQVTGDGTQRRDFVYVRDIAQANYLAATKEDVRNEVFNIGNGKSYEINEIAEAICGEGNFSYIPERQGEARETLADNSKATKMLGWIPKTDLKKGISKTLEYYGGL